jgi:hypothetical protein
MRVFLGVAALSAVVVPAGGQEVRVRASNNDSVRVFVMERATVDGVRALRAELDVLLANIRRMERELRGVAETGDASQSSERLRERLLAVQDGLVREYAQLYPKQSRLTLACAMLRAASRGREGYIGVTFEQQFTFQSPTAGASVMQVTEGPPRIDAVDPGSPADEAGVRAGDEWIALNGRQLSAFTDSELDVLLKPGMRVVMRVRNGGRERDVHVAVGRRPEFPAKECEAAGGFAIAGPIAGLFTGSMPPGAIRVPVEGRVAIAPRPDITVPRLAFTADVRVAVYGATFRNLDADAREVVKLEGDGVFVDHVSPGTPAHAAGLRSFDVVTRVNGQTVNSPLDVRRATDDERTLVLTVVRGGETRTVTLVKR